MNYKVKPEDIIKEPFFHPEGKEMLVSDNAEDWHIRTVICYTTVPGLYYQVVAMYGINILCYKYVAEIPKKRRMSSMELWTKWVSSGYGLDPVVGFDERTDTIVVATIKGHERIAANTIHHYKDHPVNEDWKSTEIKD